MKYNLIIYFLLVSVLFFPFSAYSAVTAGDGGGGPKYKHYEVTKDSGITAEQINAKLENRGKLKGMGEVYIEASKSSGIDALFLVSLNIAETGGTSPILMATNNVGNIKCRAATPRSQCHKTVSRNQTNYWEKFPSIEEGIKYHANFIRGYVDSGLDTVYKIQQKYCPDSDLDCSTTWVTNVSRVMEGFGLGTDGGYLSPTGEYVEGGSGSGGSSSPDVFNQEDVSVDNVGVDGKDVFDRTSTGYVTNKYLGKVSSIMFKIAQVVSIFMIGFLVILWLLAVLSLSGIEVANDLLMKFTYNRIDIMEDGLHKFALYTGFTFFILVVVVTGLLPKFFVFIYYYLSMFIDFLGGFKAFY